MRIMRSVVWLAAFVLVGCTGTLTPAPPSPTAVIILANPQAVTPNTPVVVPSPSFTQQPTARAQITATTVPTISSPTNTPGSTWKTFVSAQFQIALDYPADWSARETATGINFTSPQGARIDLSEIDTRNQPPEDFLIETQLPNTRCTNSTNESKVAVRNCFDTVASSYTANLILKPANNATRLMTLVTRAKGVNTIFTRMVASTRLAP